MAYKLLYIIKGQRSSVLNLISMSNYIILVSVYNVRSITTTMLTMKILPLTVAGIIAAFLNTFLKTPYKGRPYSNY